jgi:hypothetical protein
MSTCSQLTAAVEGGIERGMVLPAAPDDAEPGAGQDADGVRVAAAAVGRRSAIRGSATRGRGLRAR